jgi:DNA-directed RNA polymerase specialized sigma24 family protein
MGGVAVDWFDLPVDVLAIGTTRPAIGDPTTDLDLVERALDGLSLADRTLLALHHVKHLSLGEIGERLGCQARP